MKFCAFDTEDNSPELLAGSATTPKMTQICALGSDGSDFYNKGNGAEFRKWLRQKKMQLAYAHNLQYDLGNLFRERMDELNPTLIGPRMIRCTWKAVEFRDSLNLCPTSLAKIGDALGLKKLTGRTFSDREYVQRDVEIVLKFVQMMKEFSGRYGIADLPSTIGSLAIKIWKKQGGKNWFDDDAFHKRAYYGGRVELFGQRSFSASYTDINSLYPWGLTQGFPGPLEITRRLDGYGIAEVTIAIPKTVFVSPLPWRDEDTGKKLFPVGKIRGVWTFAEIHAAVEAGARVLKIHSAEGSKQVFFPYKDFIGHFYQKRLDAKSDMEKLYYKLLMNNLYGQLATSGKLTVAADEPLRGCVARFGTRYLVEINVALPQHTNWCHAAHVTSYGRIRLLDFLRRVPKSKLLYCDTDSIICHDGPFYPCSADLGEMKLVDKQAACVIHGPKCYVFNGQAKAKGVPVSKAAEFIKNGIVKFSKPARMLESLKRNLDWSRWYQTEKTIRTGYTQKILKGKQWHPPALDGG